MQKAAAAVCLPVKSRPYPGRHAGLALHLGVVRIVAGMTVIQKSKYLPILVLGFVVGVSSTYYSPTPSASK